LQAHGSRGNYVPGPIADNSCDLKSILMLGVPEDSRETQHQKRDGLPGSHLTSIISVFQLGRFAPARLAKTLAASRMASKSIWPNRGGKPGAM
jgi:hypothetical protein